LPGIGVHHHRNGRSAWPEYATNRYATVDLDMKRKAIEQARPTDFGLEPALWRTDASILEWLDAL